MKFVIAALALTFAVSTASAAQEPITYVCQELQRDVWEKDPNGRTLVISQIGVARELKEGKTYPFQLLILEAGSKNVLVSKRVLVQTEDVMFAFRSSDRTLSGMIFLDELNQTSVTIKGQELRFDCGE